MSSLVWARQHTAASLKEQAKEHTGHVRDAFILAAANVEDGWYIPQDIRNIIDQARSFTQDKWGK